MREDEWVLILSVLTVRAAGGGAGGLEVQIWYVASGKGCFP